MFIALNKSNPALILTTLRPDGSGNQWKPARLVGPGGYAARTFATEAGAAKHGTASYRAPAGRRSNVSDEPVR